LVREDKYSTPLVKYVLLTESQDKQKKQENSGYLREMQILHSSIVLPMEDTENVILLLWNMKEMLYKMRKSCKNTFIVTIRDYLVQRTGGTYLLVEAPWSTEHMLSELDNEELTKPFTMEEIELVVKEMKTNTAPGPDGLPVIF
jgi:hypothetical protein